MTLTAYLDDIGCVTTTSTFGMKCMYCSVFDRSNSILYEPTLIERVCMDHHLDIHIVSYIQTVIDCCWRSTPVLMKLERAGSSIYLFDQTFRQ